MVGDLPKFVILAALLGCFMSQNIVRGERASIIVENQELRFSTKQTYSYEIHQRHQGKNVNSRIKVTTNLRQGDNVNLFVIYGSQSEFCSLSKQDNVCALTLCHDMSEDIEEIHIMLEPKSAGSLENVVSFSAEWTDISLRLGDESEPIMVNPQYSTTFLIDHTSHPKFDRKNRFVLNVETTSKVRSNLFN